MGRPGLRGRRLGAALVLSTLLIVGVLGLVGWLFGMPCSITKLVRTAEGEELKVSITVTGRPDFVSYLNDRCKRTLAAWGVGGVEVSTVNIKFQVTVTGTNIANTAKVYFYVEARDSSGSPTYRELDYSSSPQTVTVGSTATYETGSMTIDSHLSHLYGSAPTCDKTVDYYVWCRVEATGLISGETLTAEIPVTKFDSVIYDYGDYAWVTVYPKADSYVDASNPDSNYGSSDTLKADSSSSFTRWIYLAFDIPSSASDADKLKIYQSYSSGDGRFELYTTGPFNENTVTWNNKPELGTYLDYDTIDGTGWVDFSSSELDAYVVDNEGGTAYFAIVGVETETYGRASGQFYSRERSVNRPYLEVYAVDWSASWSWLNLDTLSITALQVVQDVLSIVTMLLSIVVSYLTIKILRRRVK